eukprot:2259700-Pleurochrysis_carterae.AAC.1
MTTCDKRERSLHTYATLLFALFRSAREHLPLPAALWRRATLARDVPAAACSPHGRGRQDGVLLDWACVAGRVANSEFCGGTCELRDELAGAVTGQYGCRMRATHVPHCCQALARTSFATRLNRLRGCPT